MEYPFRFTSHFVLFLNHIYVPLYKKRLRMITREFWRSDLLGLCLGNVPIQDTTLCASNLRNARVTFRNPFTLFALLLQWHWRSRMITLVSLK